MISPTPSQALCTAGERTNRRGELPLQRSPLFELLSTTSFCFVTFMICTCRELAACRASLQPHPLPSQHSSQFLKQHEAADAHTEPMQNISAHSHQSISVRHGLLPAGGPLWDVHACKRAQRCCAPSGMPALAPTRSHPHALMHQCIEAPAQPCTHLPMRHESACPGSRGSSCQHCSSAVCCLHSSGHGNCCCVMKCCPGPRPGAELCKGNEK